MKSKFDRLYMRECSNLEGKTLEELKSYRQEVLRDMEQEAEPEGGEIADYYGELLDQIDTQIEKLHNTGEKQSEVKQYPVVEGKESFDKAIDSFMNGFSSVNEVKAGLDVVQLKQHSKKIAQKGDKLGDLVVSLKDIDASNVTKLANKLSELQKITDDIKTQREGLQATAKEIDEKYFDPSDYMFSRVLKTGRTYMKFAKIVGKAESKLEVTNPAAVKAAFADIEKLLIEQGVDLSKQLKNILKDTVTIKKIAASEGTRKLPTSKVDESIKAFAKDVLDKVKRLGSDLKTYLKDWASSFDAKNTDINSKLSKVASLI